MPSATSTSHVPPAARHRRRRRRGRAAAVAASVAVGGALGAVAPFATGPAQAAEPIVTTGDILVTTGPEVPFGRYGVERIDPVSHEQSRAISFGLLSGENEIASDANGDFYVANFDGDVVKVDHLTGEDTTIREGTGESAFNDLAVDPAGRVLGLLREDSGTRLVRVDADGSLHVLSQGQLMVDPAEMAVEWDGRVLVTDTRGRVLRVDPATGSQSLLADLDRGVDAIAVRPDSQVFVRSQESSTTVPQLVRIDPVSGSQKVVSSGGALRTSLGSNGLAFENGTDVVAAEFLDSEVSQVVRIDTDTGAQSVLAERNVDGALDVAVAGRSQVPPEPRVTAATDTFSTTANIQGITVPAPGVLGNDADPLKQPLTAALAGPSTTVAGSITMRPDGSFTYRHAAGFVGTARYFYQAHAGTRTSPTATIVIDVRPAPAPVANPDKLSMARQAGQVTGQVLKNDTDPLGQTLHAVVEASSLEHGFVSFFSDGSFFYFPDPGFVGTETFTYRAVAEDGRTSDRGTVTIQVIDNAPPVVAVHPGGSVPLAGTSGTVKVGAADTFTPAARLTVKASTSNAGLVPAGNVTIGAPSGQGGSERLVRIVPVAGKTGSAVVTVTATDEFGASAAVAIRVRVGDAGANALTGTSGTDVLLGGGGADTLVGGAGVDLLGGGPGDDTLTGGTGSDIFRGGTGVNTATDANPAAGDVVFEIG